MAIKLAQPVFGKLLKATITAEQLFLIMILSVRLLIMIKKYQYINITNQKNVGISSCTTRVVYTYMCKELLETAGKELGYQIHIECQGQRGPGYVLSNQEIKEADMVI